MGVSRRRAADWHVEEVRDDTEDRTVDAFDIEPLRPLDDDTRYRLVQPGLVVPADVQESPEWQSRRSHGAARRDEAGVPALPWRQLPRRAELREPLQLEGDHRSHRTAADA